jgi:hypothetical protein
MPSCGFCAVARPAASPVAMINAETSAVFDTQKRLRILTKKLAGSFASETALAT